MHTSTTSNQSNTAAGRLRFSTVATRLVAGVGVSLAALTVVGGSAFAGSEEPGPPPVIPFTPIDLDPEFEVAPIDPPIIDLDDLTIPDDDGDEPPVLEIPELEIPDFTIPEIPDLTIPEIPDLPDLPDQPQPCALWDPADMSVMHVDNGDGTLTATLAYADPANVCDEVFVVHSVAVDQLMNEIGLLAAEHVTIGDLAADADNTIEVVVPLDPCYTRVFTGLEANTLLETYHGEGCPDPTETTEPEPTETTETTEPETTETTEPTDPTVPPTVPPSIPTTVPGSQTLPVTGSSSTVIALIGGALLLAGGALAIGVRKSQTSN